MLNVEDVLEEFFNAQNDPSARYIFSDWLFRFVGNVFMHVEDGKAISTEQSNIIMRLANKHKAFLIKRGLDEMALSTLLKMPSHRRPPYQSSNIPREVRYIGDNKLAFRFKFNDVIIEELKQLKPKSSFAGRDQFPIWHPGYRVWIVSINRDNIERVMRVIRTQRFSFDDPVAEYLTLASNSLNQRSSFVLDPETGNIVANICDNEFVANWVSSVLQAERL